MMSRTIMAGLLTSLQAISVQAQQPSSVRQELPNILWITSDDNSPTFLGCYGSDLATTPNMDNLAKQGFRYTRAYANAPICAPSRNTIITGVYASSGGNHHMRSNYSKSDVLKLLPEYLRELGYYCTNNVKEDYNIESGRIEGSDPGVIWDESSLKAHYKNRKPGQPFFAVFNTMMSHESSIHKPDSGRATRHDPARVKLPSYHPDTKEIRHDWARYYDVVENMDAWVGDKLKELEDAGLAHNTIVIYYSDHGGIIARSKRYLYETGTHIPFIIRIPEKYKHLYPGAEPGAVVDRMIGLIDLLPTMLSIAGVKELPEYLQGHAFLGPLKTAAPEYVYGIRGRMDERTDMMRSVKDKRFRYIRNYYPFRSNGIYNRYMWRAVSTRSWHEAYLNGNCNAAQSAYFETKPVEELYDTENDYWEVNNLAYKPEYADVLLRMRAENSRWMEDIRDAGFFPEAELKKISEKQPLYDYMRSGKESVKQHIAAGDLANFATVKDVGRLTRNLAHDNPVLRYWAALGLRKLGKEAAPAIPALTKALNDVSPDVAIAAAEALYFAGVQKPAVNTLIKALESPEMTVRLHALNIIDITCKYDEGVLKAIEKMLARPNMPENQFDTFLGKWMLETGTNQRLLVLTDISSLRPAYLEADDAQSLIRLMLYANEFELEGFVVSSKMKKNQMQQTQLVRQIIEAYGKVQPNLLKHDQRFPSAGRLQGLVKKGQASLIPVGKDPVVSFGKGKDTEGSEWIIKVVDKPDTRPVWISIWGGAADLAQALWKVRQTRSKAELNAFIEKIRVRAITDQDSTGRWILEKFPGIWYLRDTYSYPGMYRQGDNKLIDSLWVVNYLHNPGNPLGSLYPNYYYGPRSVIRGVKEGDSPSYLGMIPNGLNISDMPELGGWGGIFQKIRNDYYSDADSILPVEARGGLYSNVHRWRAHWQADFRARLEWCTNSYAAANHAPAVVVNDDSSSGPLTMWVAEGETIVLDAGKSTDPDGDSLTFHWSVYPEDAPASIALQNADSAQVTIRPEWKSGLRMIPVLLTVTDNGQPALHSYRRILLRAGTLKKE